MIKPLMQKVLIVVSSADSSIHAAKYGILLSKLYHSTLKAVYVVDTATLRQLTLNKFFVADESREYEESLERDGERYLEYVQELGEQKGVKIETQLLRGSVWSEVVKAANVMGADLILLGGIENRGDDRRDVLSTAYREILTNANCSVLMVREEMIDQMFRLA
ncbi:MAG: universal stress protein [Treponema sp.]|nr:universal stress protein [Candidatus Treponema caballi]